MKYLFLLLILLVGCGHTPPPPDPSPVAIEVNCEDYGQIEPVQVYPVKFVGATDREGNQVLGLRGDQYSNLALNIRGSIRYITEQKKVISYYKTCIDDHNSKAQNIEGEPE